MLKVKYFASFQNNALWVVQLYYRLVAFRELPAHNVLSEYIVPITAAAVVCCVLCCVCVVCCGKTTELLPITGVSPGL